MRAIVLTQTKSASDLELTKNYHAQHKSCGEPLCLTPGDTINYQYFPRGNKVLYYTTTSLQDLGIYTSVNGKYDTVKARELALHQLQDMVDDPAYPAVTSDSFSDGLSRDDLVLFKPEDINNEDISENSDLIEGIKRIAAFAILKTKKDKAGAEAIIYQSVINRLFAEEPLSEEDYSIIADKSFEKNLSRFAAAATEYTEQLTNARAAVELLDSYLKPYIQAGQIPEILQEIQSEVRQPAARQSKSNSPVSVR